MRQFDNETICTLLARACSSCL